MAPMASAGVAFGDALGAAEVGIASHGSDVTVPAGRARSDADR
ncbi:hypothetical protein AB0M46_37940 [Dactylosporangium sp. NPDC051485]